MNGRGSLTGGITFSVTVAVYVFFSLIFSIIVVAAGLDSSSDVYIYINYLIAPAAVAVSVPVVSKFRRVPLKTLLPLGFQSGKSAAKYFAAAALLAFGLLFSLSWLNIGFERLLRLLGYEGTVSYFPDLSGGKVVAALLVMAVMPALFEEILFRGAVLQNIREEAGELNSIFLCGMCFALFHANALQTFYQFICGCAFALLAIRARSLFPCVLAHFLNNAVIVVMQACGLNTSGTLFDMLPLWAAILVTVLSALSLIGGALILICDKTPLKKPVKGGIKKFFLSASVGIAVLAVLWIVGLFS